MDQDLSLDDLGQVIEELHDLSPQWYGIGLQLKLSPDALDKIKGEESDSSVQLRKMLMVWLKKVEPKPTWEALVIALRSRSVGREKEANAVESKYCQTKEKESHPSPSAKSIPEIKCSNCKQGCTWQGKQEKLDEHRSKCPKEEIACPYSEAGCEERCLREGMEEHVTQYQQKHLDSAMETIKALKTGTTATTQIEAIPDQVNKLAKAVEEIQKTLECCQQTPPLTLQVRGLTKISHDNPCYSQSFYTSARGYRMRFCATPISKFLAPGEQGIQFCVEVIPGINDCYLAPICTGRVDFAVQLDGTKTVSIHDRPNSYFKGSPNEHVIFQLEEKYYQKVFYSEGLLNNIDCIRIHITQVKLDNVNLPWLENFTGKIFKH